VNVGDAASHGLQGHIQILDRAALEDISCEYYAVIRQNVDKVFFGSAVLVVRKSRLLLLPLRFATRAMMGRISNPPRPQRSTAGAIFLN